MTEKKYVEVSMTDYQLVSSALLNKGMGFTKKERDDFGLHGLIPPTIATLEQQKKRAYEAFCSKSSPLERYIYLRDLQDSNETLYFAVLDEHLEELLPVIYTPTVGLGCQEFSHIYRRPRGLFISYPLRDQMDNMLKNTRFKHVEIMVVSDGERILGLGDQGAGGMGIPIGKLALYTACAGIHPRASLPVLLDVGTDNPTLINDPLYVGWRHERIRGEKYYQFIDQFVRAVKKRFPKILLQWEDFAKNNATTILNKYQNKICTFNDDVQGTAAVVLATLLAAVETSNTPLNRHRILIVGAGSAGCGIANLIVAIMQKRKMTEKKALENIFLFDQKGLLTEKTENILPFQEKFRKDSKEFKNKEINDLKEMVLHTKPTVLIGVTAQPGLFTQEIVQTMASLVEKPIIFPLSNPDSRAEATPANISKWTNGKALIGTGSPFAPIEKNGKSFRVDQTNNSYIFPGLGLGTIAVKAKEVTQSMFLIASETLASMSPARKDKEANLLPPLSDSKKIAYNIAVAVAKEAVRCGVANRVSAEEIKKMVRQKMWEPIYHPYKKVKKS